MEGFPGYFDRKRKGSKLVGVKRQLHQGCLEKPYSAPCPALGDTSLRALTRRSSYSLFFFALFAMGV